MRISSGLLALVFVIGCDKTGQGDTSNETESDPKPDTEPPKASGLEIRIDGKPRASAKGFIKRRPDGTFQIYVGQGGSCGELLVNVFNGKNEFVLIDVATHLAPDGKEALAVTGVHDKGSIAKAEDAAPVSMRGEPDQGARVEIEMAFAGKGDKGEAVEVKGAMPLEGCGDQDTSKGPLLPQAEHPSSATMTIGGKTIAIRAALRKGQTIVLADFPRVCAGAWLIGASLELERGQWTLAGARFADKSRGEAKALTVKPGKTGESADGPTVALELSGSDSIGDYPVAIAGTIEALDCK